MSNHIIELTREDWNRLEDRLRNIETKHDMNLARIELIESQLDNLQDQAHVHYDEVE